MNYETVVKEARAFERSSTYRYGDRTAFSIRLAPDVVLRGPNSAAAYLDSLGLETLPEQVMIVCPGNGGLVTECYLRGAKRVITVETRTRFQRTLRTVMRLQEQLWATQGTDDLSYRLVDRWEQVSENDGFRDVDLILWPEGLEEITHPKKTFAALASALNPGGKLFVEVQHGKHKWVEKINSWRPSEHAMLDMCKEVFGQRWDENLTGRHGQSSSCVVVSKKGKPAKATPKEETVEETVVESVVEDLTDEPIVITDETETETEPAGDASPADAEFSMDLDEEESSDLSSEKEE